MSSSVSQPVGKQGGRSGRFARRLACALVALASVASAAQIGPRVPLAHRQTFTLRGDLVAAGVGLRSRGAGVIDVVAPASGTPVAAFLYWTVLDAGRPPAVVTLNGARVTGTLVAQAGDPCWPTQNAAMADPPALFAWVQRADVTGLVVSGANLIEDVPSGLTGGEDALEPAANRSAFPLADGASLLVVYAVPGAPLRTIVLHDGGDSFFADARATTFDLGGFVPSLPASAEAVWVVADGQAFFAGDAATVDGLVVAGPGGALRPADAFDGRDGGAPLAPHGLWDTLVADVSGLVDPDAAALTTGVVAGPAFDCVTWVAAAVSVAVEVPEAPTSTTTSTSTTSSTSTSTTSSTSTSTTSSTSTSTTSSTSTSTSTSSSTSTSTVPACPDGATFASLTCRLDRLMAGVDAAERAGPLGAKLLATLGRARALVADAEEADASGQAHRPASRLRRAERRLVAFGHRVRSLRGRRLLLTDDPEAFVAEAEAIRADLLVLREMLR